MQPERAVLILIYGRRQVELQQLQPDFCLLYTSDAADELLCVDLGGRRILQKKKCTTVTRTGQTDSHSRKTSAER